MHIPTVVMVIEKDTPSGHYSFQTVVIPNRYLVVDYQNDEAEPSDLQGPNASIKHDTKFEGTVSGI